MAGQLRTFTRNFYPTGSTQTLHESFVSFVQYFENHPGFAKIASNFGTSGTGLSSSFLFSNVAGENAFAVFRAASSSQPYDISFCWSYNLFTAGRWTDPITNFGFGMQLAWHSSSQAWSGTTNYNGSDSFFTSNRPWKSGSIVFPRQNGIGGATVTNKNGLLKIIDSSLLTDTIWQLTIIGDDDITYAFFQNSEEAAYGNTQKFITFGRYVPFTSSYTLPLVTLAAEISTRTVVIGSTTTGDSSGDPNGGISYTTSSDCRSYKLNFPTYAPERVPRIAKQLLNEANSRTYIYPIVLTSYETNHYHQLGILSGVYVSSVNAFGNIQDVSRSFVTIKPITDGTHNFCMVMPFSGSSDFFLKGTFE